MSIDKNNFVASTLLKALSDLRERLLKAREDEDEEDTVPDDFQDYPISEEDLRGLRIQEGETSLEDDEAARWLAGREQAEPSAGEEADEEEAPAQAKEPAVAGRRARSSFREWEPHGEYADHEVAHMRSLTEQGYTPREAEKLSGAHRMPTNWEDALRHNVWPSPLSDKHHEDLKKLTGHWLHNKSKLEAYQTDPEKNPIKHAREQMVQTHKESTADYAKALNDYMSSDTFNNLKGRDRHNALRDWKNQYKVDNPEYHKKIADASQAQRHYTEASATIERNILDRNMRIMGAGDMPTGMTDEEAAQHVGGVKTERGTQATIIQDPIAALGAKSPQLRAAVAREMAEPRFQKLLQRHGTPEQQARLKSTTSAKAAQGQQPIAPQKPKTVIRRPSGSGGGSGAGGAQT